MTMTLSDWSITAATPATEPVTLAELRKQARLIVDSGGTTDEDDELQQFGKAARTWAEEFTGRPFVRRTYTIKTSALSREMLLPVYNVLSVDSVTYIDTDGNQQTIDASNYGVFLRNGESRLYFVRSFGLPSLDTDTPNAVTITLTAGFADDAIPEDIRAAILIYAATLFEHRESVVIGTIATPVPMSAEMLLRQYRIYSV